VLPVKTIAFVDVETGGLNPAVDPLLEVGLVIWSVPHRSIIRCESTLLHAEKNDAFSSNGIPVGLVRECGESRRSADVLLAEAITEYDVDAIIAHNAEFDRPWFAPCVRAPWLCSMDDFDYPRASSGKSLTAIALAHGVGVVHAHRAMADCLTLAALFERVAEILDAKPLHEPGHEPAFEHWLARAARPRATYQALVSFDDKDKAKQLGFRWNAEAKTWTKRLAREDVGALPFRVQEIQ